MYLTLLILPGLSSLIIGLFGRKIGYVGSRLIALSFIVTASILTIVAFYEVVLCNSPVYLHIGSWISTEYLTINWAFQFDQLTCSILLAVVLVSTIVHFYSVDYIGHDPHIQRFFSYLSLFTFLIVVLVCGDSYFILFLGYFSA